MTESAVPTPGAPSDPVSAADRRRMKVLARGKDRLRQITGEMQPISSPPSKAEPREGDAPTANHAPSTTSKTDDVHPRKSKSGETDIDVHKLGAKEVTEPAVVDIGPSENMTPPEARASTSGVAAPSSAGPRLPPQRQRPVGAAAVSAKMEKDIGMS